MTVGHVQTLGADIARAVSGIAANIWGQVMRPFRDRRLILCYHSLGDRTGDYQDRGYISRRQRLDVREFEAQLEWLSGWASFMTLDALIEDKGEGWRIALTFDDGYADNLELGCPLFEKYRAPITWFVCPYFVERHHRLPWWDLVDYVEWAVREHVEFSVGDKRFRYNLDRKEERDRFRNEQRNRFLQEEIEARSTRYEAIVVAVEEHVSIPRNGFATQEEIVQAAQSPWITIGGHTVTHQNLATCARETVKNEVNESRRILQEWTDQPVRWFCYPFGGPAFWNEDVAAIVAEAGCRGSATLVPDYVEQAPHAFAIPRISIAPSCRLADFQARVLGSDVFRTARAIKHMLR